jgi:hypothetical protein
LTYTDGGNNSVTLQLTGGGQMELFRGPDGEARLLRLEGVNPGRSTLSGSVSRPRAGGTGVTFIPRIVGLNGVNNQLQTPPFFIGSATAAAVDQALSSPGITPTVPASGAPHPLGPGSTVVRMHPKDLRKIL